MILKRFYDDKLAQASYLIGCAKTGEACVIDPNRDLDQYIQAADAESLRITAVTETHIHADFCSGSRELADRTGAKLYLSDEGNEEWKYTFANQPNVQLVKDGDHIRIGNVRLDVVHTPGHTPEHISFVLTDEPASSKPLGVFTGDFIFVGDVGRPDLLERAAGYQNTMEAGAKVLFNALSKFKNSLPDTVMIWPAHGAGSACGKSLGGVPVSTLGYEKDANWGLKTDSEANFVDTVLSGQPEPPYYFKEMKRLNKVGPRIRKGITIPARMEAAEIVDLLKQHAVIVDLRSRDEAAQSLLPGVLSIPMNKSFTTWAGWLLPYDKPIYLLASTREAVEQAVKDLAMIGLDDVSGWFGIEALDAADKAGIQAEVIPQITATEAIQRFKTGEAEILDIRGANEYTAGHIPGVDNIPLGYIDKHLDELPKHKPLILHCAGGSRSCIGVSYLRSKGFTNAVNLTGGFGAYENAGLEIETGAQKETAKA